MGMRQHPKFEQAFTLLAPYTDQQLRDATVVQVRKGLGSLVDGKSDGFINRVRTTVLKERIFRPLEVKRLEVEAFLQSSYPNVEVDHHPRGFLIHVEGKRGLSNAG